MGVMCSLVHAIVRRSFQIATSIDGYGSSMGPDEDTVFFQLLKIPAYRDFGDIQQFAEAVDLYLLPFLKIILDQPDAFQCKHGATIYGNSETNQSKKEKVFVNAVFV